MVKKKRTIYLTQEQYDAIEKFDEEGHRDALNAYSGQTYNYGHNDGTVYGLLIGGISCIIGAGVIKLSNYFNDRKQK